MKGNIFADNGYVATLYTRWYYFKTWNFTLKRFVKTYLYFISKINDIHVCVVNLNLTGLKNPQRPKNPWFQAICPSSAPDLCGLNIGKNPTPWAQLKEESRPHGLRLRKPNVHGLSLENSPTLGKKPTPWAQPWK